MVRFDFRPYAREHAAVCTSVSKGASRLKKVTGNSFEQQKTLRTQWKVKGLCWQTPCKIRATDRLSQEIRKMSDTKH